MKIKLIWAQDLNGGIGFKNDLPWFSKEDLKNFKLITLNSTIVMGRKGLSDSESNLGHVTTKVLSLTSKPVVLV